MNRNELLATRHDLFVKADTVLQSPKRNGKDLSGDERIVFDGCIAQMREIDTKLDAMEKHSTAPFERERGFPALPTQQFNSAPPVVQPTAFARDTEGKRLPLFKKEQSIEAYMRQELGSPEDGEVTLGGVCRAMAIGGGSPAVRNALSIGTDSAGGFTVPVLTSALLIDALRARCQVMAAGAQTLVLDGGKSTTIAAIASDPTAAWKSEGAAVATSDMTFSPVTLTPKTLAVIVTASRELVEDSLNLDQ